MNVFQIALVSTTLGSTIDMTVRESKSGHKDSTIASIKRDVVDTLPRPEEVMGADELESKCILAFFEGA